VAEVARRFGRLDALVNNAGIAVFAPLLETADADWSRILKSISPGPFSAPRRRPDARAWRRGDRQHHLDLGRARLTLRSAYGTSKAGLAHLTKQLAVEFGSARHPRQRRGARSVETAMAKAVIRRRSAPTITTRSLNRYRLEEELAEAIFFCAAIGRATSPGRFSPSTAASTPPASACRPCAASGGRLSFRFASAFAVAA
jgi:NAD(P)-dependent dehydrogenase (short-subunit alcohol dehydrogenase family)